MVGQSLVSLLENFRAALKKFVSEAFRASSIDTQFHVDTAVDGNTLCFPGDTKFGDGRGSTKSEDVIHPAGDTAFIEFQILCFRSVINQQNVFFCLLSLAFLLFSTFS